MGKLETGRLAKGKKLIVMPNGSKVKVAQIDFEENPIKVGVAGMNLKVSYSKDFILQIFMVRFRSVLKVLRMTNNSKKDSYYVMLAMNATKELFSMPVSLFKNIDPSSRK